MDSFFSSIFSSGKKYKNAICVGIDTDESCFDFYTMSNGDSGTVEITSKNYKGRLYSSVFMSELTEAVREFMSGRALQEDTSVTLLVPDNAVMIDTVSVPNMNKKRNDKAVFDTITGIYKNRDDLAIKQFYAGNSKHVAIYSLTIMNDKLLKSFSVAMTEGGLTPTIVTFASNGLVDAVNALCPSVKDKSYLLLDIKHHTARFAFVANGRVTGFYSLPFGYSILKKAKVYSEDMLFDHSVAELAVLNAREKAKAKQLTMAGGPAPDENASDEEKLDSMFGDDEEASFDPTTAQTTATYKTLPKKQPRKLPKFMLRDTPKDDEGCSYENFRIFMKWALNLLASNDKITNIAKPECVYVNMPGDLSFLFDMANEEKDNGYEFRPLAISGNTDDITDNLELYGALFAPQYDNGTSF